jgi:hypothetical protein
MTAPGTGLVAVEGPGAAVQRVPLAPLRPIAAPATLLAAQNETRAAVTALLVENRDFGIIPGVKKPSLFQPGAERINLAFGVVARFRVMEKEMDHDREQAWEKTSKKGGKYGGISTGFYRYVVECELVLRDSGQVVGTAIASCSTLESKYIDRPRDSENTVLQMAEKRAFVRATRTAFGLSDEFTQDVEDQPRETVEEDRAPAPPPPPKKAMTLADALALPFPLGKPEQKGSQRGRPLEKLSDETLQSALAWLRDKELLDRYAEFVEAAGLVMGDREKAQGSLPLDPTASPDSSASAAGAGASPSPSKPDGSSPTPPSTSGASTTGTTTATATADYGTGPIASTMKPAVAHTGPADPTSRHAITHELKALCDDERLAVSLREASRAVLKNPNATLAQLTRRRDEMLARLPKAIEDTEVLDNEDDDLPF